MHKRGYCRHAVSVCPSVCLSRSWIMSKRINISSKFFHRRVATPFYRTGWRYSGGNPPNGGVKCRWGVGTNRDSGLIAIEDCWMWEVPKTFTHDEAEYMTQSATHHWLSIYRWTCKLRSDKNSYRRPRSVDRTVGDAPANVCDGLQHGQKRRRQENRKEFNCTQRYI